jgi:serine kinase of HPr protein (carbohydrate metabolism regulator)
LDRVPSKVVLRARDVEHVEVVWKKNDIENTKRSGHGRETRRFTRSYVDHLQVQVQQSRNVYQILIQSFKMFNKFENIAS